MHDSDGSQQHEHRAGYLDGPIDGLESFDHCESEFLPVAEAPLSQVA